MIELRDFSQDDIESLVKNANSASISRYMLDTFPYPYTCEDAEWWISTGSKIGIHKAIIHDNQFAGTVGLKSKTAEKRFEAEIGYWLGELHWGKGIAAQAVKLLTEYAFDNTHIQRISAGVFSPNTASMRVLEKAGFHKEAILKQSIYKNNEFYDEHLFVKFRE
ncbi:GNAT family N-acetyltransferase [Sansalvadorimonas sp. 2012CJ34-2]|uniref:GNAT family N-acetyltransferase n=1 Tax=Parendozoicomonas callyspongiae TaxID=2942213 RepID=A0ABT0PGW1_9GAMM|nr:GNAT family protein [Sansalvadorimonas sp. 2012CJ34-2]MCL6270619.1 GNAT family N-acetyltransferase [Sansalvadorimonas sp. 2012CJ34-2]